MTAEELIKKLEEVPQDYHVIFESGDAWIGSAYAAYVDDIIVHDKNKQIELIEI